MKERSVRPGWGTLSNQGQWRRVPGRDASEPDLRLFQGRDRVGRARPLSPKEDLVRGHRGLRRVWRTEEGAPSPRAVWGTMAGEEGMKASRELWEAY